MSKFIGCTVGLLVSPSNKLMCVMFYRNATDNTVTLRLASARNGKELNVTKTITDDQYQNMLDGDNIEVAKVAFEFLNYSVCGA